MVTFSMYNSRNWTLRLRTWSSCLRPFPRPSSPLCRTSLQMKLRGWCGLLNRRKKSWFGIEPSFHKKCTSQHRYAELLYCYILKWRFQQNNLMQKILTVLKFNWVTLILSRIHLLCKNKAGVWIIKYFNQESLNTIHITCHIYIVWIHILHLLVLIL